VYTLQNIVNVVNGVLIKGSGNVEITELVYDSRTISFAERSLFFALQSSRQDGHNYISKAYQKGVRNFVVSKQVALEKFDAGNFILVADVQKSLQVLAAHHRKQFSIPVIGITGSNGKTIVKEWLYQLLQPEFNIIRSPKSYNSQIGVPLSVWQMNEDHTLGIFEAGISQKGEMKSLAEIIQPTIGVLTNIGEAHSEGFESQTQKLEEKLILFKDADVVIGPGALLTNIDAEKRFTWGSNVANKIQIVNTSKEISRSLINVKYASEDVSFTVPFTDEASIENCITCISVLFKLGYNKKTIQERISSLHAIDMRLQLKQGINHCTIINDSYSADLTSLNIALHFLTQQQTGQQKIAVLSDFAETGKEDKELYEAIADALKNNKIQKLIAVGPKSETYLPLFLPASLEVQYYKNTEEFIQNFRTSFFSNATVLIKGARQFGFERIVSLLDAKVHQTVLEVNLNAIAHNLKQFQKALLPGTRIMAMVKAFAYGSGGAEIAAILQFNNVDYLGVAYADEGIELRKMGISIPIMVLNTDESSFNALIDYNLQPVIFSFSLLHQFETFIKEQGLSNFPVHLEIETGMNRLGFSSQEIPELTVHLQESSFIKIESVFSHLAASEDPNEDAFTNLQATILEQACKQIESVLSYSFLKHIANSAAIIRHPNLQMDMVRLGIGLYGIEVATNKLALQPVASLRTTIAQIKKLHKGETVSYNRRGKVNADATIATVRIGYADGYSRNFGNGIGKMWIKGHVVPVVGTVCMDMTMIDVTGIPGVKEGDEVIVFGEQIPVQQLAAWSNTIPYEIMTSISGRVKRVYFQE
jgi:alanine racemase